VRIFHKSFFVSHINILTSVRFSFRIYFHRLLLFYPERSTTLIEFSLWLLSSITASDTHLVSFIYDAKDSNEYVLTRLSSDGCFQAYCFVIFILSLPFSTSSVYESLSNDLGCFPLNTSYFAMTVDLSLSSQDFIQSLPRLCTIWLAVNVTVLYLLLFPTCAASTAFVENQLSPSLISLSPLFTIHPRSLQRAPVQSSMSISWALQLDHE